MMYIDWNSVPGIYEALIDDRMMRSKLYICDIISKDLSNDDYVNTWYVYDRKWLERWRKSSRDEQIKMILDVGWGPISMTMDPDPFIRRYMETGDEDDRDKYVSVATAYHTWIRASYPEWRDPTTIQHWALLHECQIMTLFIWDLLHIIDPHGSYYVVWDGSHAYVRKRGNNTIYDILWYSVGIPIFELEKNIHLSRCYPDPITFLIEEFIYEPDAIDHLLSYMGGGDDRPSSSRMERASSSVISSAFISL